MLNVNNLHFAYGRKKLFSDLQLSIEPGCIHGLLGLNGAGKTTLMKLFCGLNYPDMGDIQFRDFLPRDRHPHFLSRIYILFEEPWIPDISYREFHHIFTNFYPNFEKDYFEHCLLKFQLPQKYTLGKLSFGQKKKIMLSLALSCGVDFLLLDEPTNGLDIPSKVAFRELTADRINQNQVIILSTHQIREVESLIGSIIILNDGNVILKTSIEDINTSFHITRDREQPPVDSPGYIHSERVAGDFHTVWQTDALAAGGESGAMDLELLFNAAIAAPGKFHGSARK